MNKNLIIDTSLAHKLTIAFRRHGWTSNDIKTLLGGNFLGDFLEVIKKRSEINIIEHVIDCDAVPFVPEDLLLESHKKSGSFKFDIADISRYLSFKPKKGDYNKEGKLRKELDSVLVLNANVLEYLLEHPEIIPEKWKGRMIPFWGTIYRYPSGGYCVLYLLWTGCGWSYGRLVL